DFCSSRLAIGAATERARALAMRRERAPKPYKRDSSGVAPASPQVAYRTLLERCIGRPPKKVGRIFGPRRGLRLPAWPRLGHNFANDLAVSIDERHSPLRFIAAERLRGRVKRRARGGLGRVEGPPPSCSTGKSWLHFRPPAVDFCRSRLAIGAATE